MTVRRFVDTNVLVYAASARSEEAAKKAKALDLIGAEAFGTSGQVLAEFFTTVTRGKTPMAPDDAFDWIETLALQPCVGIDAVLVKRGIELAVRHKINYWDGAIIAAAEALGAATVYSEDLSHGQRYGAVQVLNPFLP